MPNLSPGAGSGIETRPASNNQHTIMSFKTTRRERLHMERMEYAADRSARADIALAQAAEERNEAMRQHNAEMLEYRKEEIKNQVYTLTLKGDEARDYNNWKCLRDKHRELVIAAGCIQFVAHHIDQAIESWIQRKPISHSGYEPVELMQFVKHHMREVNNRLYPHIGKAILESDCFKREDTENLINKLLGNI